MAEFESVILEAAIVDNITNTLDEIEESLHEADRAAERLDPIDIDAELADAMVELAALRGMIASIDDDIDIDADADVAGAAAAAGVGGAAESVFEESDTLTEAILDWRLTMGKFMNIFAAVIPVIAVFVGAIPAAIGGIVALAAAATAAAAALGGVFALGLLGIATQGGEFSFIDLRNRIQGVIDTFLSALTPMADAMEPLMQEAFAQLEMFFFDLATVARNLIFITDDARAALQGLGNFLPGFIEQIILLADAALPTLMSMFAALGGIDFFRAFASMMVEIVPALVTFTSILGRMLPGLMNVSMGFFAVAIAITGVLAGFLAILNIHPLLSRGFGVLVGLLLTAATVTTLYSLANTKAAQSLLALAIDAIPATIKSIHGIIASYTGATIATIALMTATLALIGVLTFGVIPAALSASGAFGALNGDIMSATESLKQFNRVGRRASGPGLSGAADNRAGGSRYPRPSPADATVVAPDKETGNAVANSMGFKHRTSNTTEQSNVDSRKHSE